MVRTIRRKAVAPIDARKKTASARTRPRSIAFCRKKGRFDSISSNAVFNALRRAPKRLLPAQAIPARPRMPSAPLAFPATSRTAFVTESRPSPSFRGMFLRTSSTMSC